MKAVSKRLSKGDTIELGDIEECHVEHSNGAITFFALHSGDEEEYVVTSTRFGDGDTIETRGKVIDVVNASGMGIVNPLAFILIPMSEYGGSDA